MECEKIVKQSGNSLSENGSHTKVACLAFGRMNSTMKNTIPLNLKWKAYYFCMLLACRLKKLNTTKGKIKQKLTNNQQKRKGLCLVSQNRRGKHANGHRNK